MYYDSHCHLDFADFGDDRALVFERARQSGISRWMIAGVRAEDWHRQQALVRSESGCEWAVGVHPAYVNAYTASEWVNVLSKLRGAFHAKTPPRAVGEMGLHYVTGAVDDEQLIRFEDQLLIAKELEVPVILHVVKGHQEALTLLNRIGALPAGGVVHGFSGSKELAAAYTSHNLHIGVSGRWCGGGGRKLSEAVVNTDLSRLLLESDAPDQSPIPNARNESTAILQAAEWVAERKGLTKKAVLVQCSNNAVGLFG